LKDKLLEVIDLTKSYGERRVLNSLSFRVLAGEIHCLVGDNGAGKSTLIKILSGALEPEAGEIRLYGKILKSLTPQLALENGIRTLYQNEDLIPHITVAENLYFAHQASPGRFFFHYRKNEAMAMEYLESLDIDIDAGRIYGELSLTEKQFVKIARALLFQPRILILDEPTSFFTAREVAKLQGLVRGLVDRGNSVIYASQHLEEVVALADRITVLKRESKPVLYDLQKEKVGVEDLTRDIFSAPKPEDLFRITLVQCLSLAVTFWEAVTGKSKVDLAEESTIWGVYNDRGVLTTRTLNKYLNLKSLPRNPRWRDVVKTANFVVESCGAQGANLPIKAELDESLEKLQMVLSKR